MASMKQSVRALSLIVMMLYVGYVSAACDFTVHPDGSSLTSEPVQALSAAEEELDLEEYLSPTEFFTVNLPAGWVTEEVVPGADLVMANSTAALERYRIGSLEEGDMILNIGFLPYALLRERDFGSLNIQFEASPDHFLRSLLPIFRLPDDTVMGDVQLISLSDARDAGLLMVSAEGQEGMILMFVAGDGIVSFMSTLGVAGELDDFRPIIHKVADSVRFSGAQDALYGALLGGR